MPKSQMGIMRTFFAFMGIMVFLAVNATCHLINQKKLPTIICLIKKKNL